MYWLLFGRHSSFVGVTANDILDILICTWVHAQLSGAVTFNYEFQSMLPTGVIRSSLAELCALIEPPYTGRDLPARLDEDIAKTQDHDTIINNIIKSTPTPENWFPSAMSLVQLYLDPVTYYPALQTHPPFLGHCASHI